ncbi:ROK family protein [Erysipelothrix sp. strain 2 (EsS2-6-Brazil)]|uniref:ROK family protein n=1 Tax=Erysipelothrix sp. strain 2 (EsS2-6-Brazil) TaxID=2500549 RepID=UPI001909451D|nr:ROK family protein [Erysipelothrix sp. strain 2 (EsS2-6-Brazil)]MBK2402577.1 ROK family protein [Erysipelothrix sp. strain 2 (EsS2-6-Brazil)]
MKYAISVDIGGTNTRVALVDEAGAILKRNMFSTDSNDPKANLMKIHEIVKAFDTPILGVGMSCPGPLDLKKGIVLTPPNLTGWHGFPLKEYAESLFDCPVFVENDANLAGLAEACLGAGQGCEVVQFLTISTGVGGGLIINQNIFQGAHGFAQEIANIILVPGGHQLKPLMPGSLESMCSGTAILARAQAVGLDVNHAGDVVTYAKKGNREAQIILDESKEYLANALAGMIGMIDPDIIVLGGGVALKIDGYVEEVSQRVKEKVYEVQKENVRIEKAKLGDDNGIIGGALLVFNSLS